MDLTKRQKTIDFLTASAGFLVTIQLMLPSFGLNGDALTLSSAVVMFLSTVGTAWKQVLSEKVNEKAKYWTYAIGVALTLGAFNEILLRYDIAILFLNENDAQITRTILTSIVVLLNVFSKFIWPSQVTQTENLLKKKKQ